ncbi:hypothetical protein Cpir12675_002086 [Ceratocystis pirilliformis]|uniref:Uncharacterized protein n=1 Tax=Ceratocystis pirilliformis TaxID=259994 RepID=A0ABR3ZCR4_9PEZI
MGRSDNPQPAAGLQHPQPQQPPSPLNNTYSAQHHQRMHSPLPLSLPSMTPPARAGSSGSSRPHSRHVSVSRGASQPPTGPTPLAAPSNIILPSPSLQPPLPQPRQLSKRSTSPERPPVSPITPPLAHVKPEATATATTATTTITATTTTTTMTMTKKTGKQNNRTIIISKPNKNAQSMQSAQAAQVTQATTQQQQPSQPLSQQPPPRSALTHNNQLDMVTNIIPPPTPLPLDLETNSDAIALQSAIAILQMQRRRAEADIIALQRAKNEALAKPEAFLADLRSGAVKMAGGLLPGEHNAGKTIPSYSDSDSSDDDSNNSDDGDIDMVGSATNGGEGSSQDQAVAAARAEKKKAKTTKNQRPPKPAWANLPGEQSIVRCPPINWAQYAVVGESLDKLHAEQVARPNGGMPAMFTASARGIAATGGGTYEFRGASALAASGPGEKYLGIAAPYVPGRDVLPNSRRKNPTVASVAGGAAAGGGRKNAKPPGRPPKR